MKITLTDGREFETIPVGEHDLVGGVAKLPGGARGNAHAVLNAFTETLAKLGIFTSVSFDYSEGHKGELVGIRFHLSEWPENCENPDLSKRFKRSG